MSCSLVEFEYFDKMWCYASSIFQPVINRFEQQFESTSRAFCDLHKSRIDQFTSTNAELHPLVQRLLSHYIPTFKAVQHHVASTWRIL